MVGFHPAVTTSRKRVGEEYVRVRPRVEPVLVDDRPARAQRHVFDTRPQRVARQQQVACLCQMQAIRTTSAKARGAPMVDPEVGVDSGQAGNVVVECAPVRHVVARGAANGFIENLHRVAALQDANRVALHHVRTHTLVL